MRVAVAVVPGLLVSIGHLSRHETPEGGREVVAQPGLELHRREPGGGPWHEDQRLAVTESVASDDPLYLLREVDDFVVAAGGDAHPLGDPHGDLLRPECNPRGGPG